MEGTPREVLDNPNLLQLILPALREDAAIYRHYIYAEEPPLDCPICAYGGVDDPNVHREHLEGWAAETTADFAVRVFPGGHFYLQTHRAGVSGGTGAGLDRVSAASHLVRSHTSPFMYRSALSLTSLRFLVGS